MVRAGLHVSIAGGIDRAVDRAERRGCDVFQIFSRNPRGWKYRDLNPAEAASFRQKMAGSGLSLAVDHMPYLPNLASPKEDVHSRSVQALAVELSRCEALGIPYLVTHLGSHLGAGKDEGQKRIVAAIEEAFSISRNDVLLLLENSAGQKNSMGSSFEDLKGIIEALGAGHKSRIGVCLDTCHLFSAGYELRTPDGVEETLRRFDALVGQERLRLVHINDSRGDLGSGLDRHEHIGLGKIGLEGFRVILSNQIVAERPLILETPVDDRRDDAANLQLVRALAEKSE
ncbi:MAG: deoxyribonuclease IV [Methanotrichaceae archaeon]|nr:deoxyribonuclease IV [Methanotrichaceae archaeon]